MGQIATVTISAVNHSVYAVTSNAVTDADAYLNARLGAGSWATQTADNKARALVSAARWIDRAVKFSGTESVPGQPRAWPRDGATCDGVAVTNGSVPDELANAEFELAFILVGNSAAQDALTQASNVRSVKAGSAGVDFFTPTMGTSADTRLPIVAHDYLKCFFAGSISAGFASGTGEDIGFAEDDFDRSEGFA